MSTQYQSEDFSFNPKDEVGKTVERKFKIFNLLIAFDEQTFKYF